MLFLNFYFPGNIALSLQQHDPGVNFYCDDDNEEQLNNAKVRNLRNNQDSVSNIVVELPRLLLCVCFAILYEKRQHMYQ